MKVVGFSAWSGAGKTTLVEQLIERLRLAGQRVSVVKHAHHDFDIDHPGKDSWRHRQAGAFEVVIASNRRLAKVREFDLPEEPTVHQLLAELSDCDWALVEGFKHSDLLKIEVWRASVGKPAQYPNDPFVVALATDSRGALPESTGLPLFDLNDPDAIVNFLLGQPERYEYHPELYLDANHLAGAGLASAGGSRPTDVDAGRGAEAPGLGRPAAD
jgi:molybdopterin-guanine dinucleotide biosynthesis protein B